MIVSIQIVLRGPESASFRDLVHKVWADVLAANSELEGLSCWAWQLDAPAEVTDCLPDREGQP